jgi:hypothetical protein
MSAKRDVHERIIHARKRQLAAASVSEGDAARSSAVGADVPTLNVADEDDEEVERVDVNAEIDDDDDDNDVGDDDTFGFDANFNDDNDDAGAVTSDVNTTHHTSFASLLGRRVRDDDDANTDDVVVAADDDEVTQSHMTPARLNKRQRRALAARGRGEVRANV